MSFVPMGWGISPRAIGEAFHGALARHSDHKNRPILKTETQESTVNIQGAIIRTVHVGEIHCGVVKLGDFPIEDDTSYIAYHQEFRSANLKHELTHHYNRASGRYLYTKCSMYVDGQLKEDSITNLNKIPISGVELLEEQGL
jgi:hypothetical protein